MTTYAPVATYIDGEDDLLPGSGTIVWDPLTEQPVKADNILRPDFTGYSTINADGGFLTGVTDQQTQEVAATQFEFGPGKFGPAVRAIPGSGRHVLFDPSGILLADEFTIEFWAMHPTKKWSEALTQFFWLEGTVLNLPLKLNSKGELESEVVSNVQLASEFRATKSASLAAFTLSATTWHNVAITLLNDVLTWYIDGVSVMTLTLPARYSELIGIGPENHNHGIRLGGAETTSSGYWISDLVISAGARIPGEETPVRSMISTFAINAAAIVEDVPQTRIGLVHPPGTYATTPAPMITDVGGLMRVDKFLSCVPSKEGAPDATHPSLGASGQSSYDWTVAKNSLEVLEKYGIPLDLGTGGCPPALGGTGAKTSGTVFFQGFPTQVPSSFAKEATMVVDLLAYIAANHPSIEIARVSVWNEPDGAFWAGTQAQYIEMYVAVAKAVREYDPSIEVGGPCSAGINYVWAEALIIACAKEGAPLDFIHFHNYTGNVADPVRARSRVDELAVAHGFKAGMQVVIGEFNWPNNFNYKAHVGHPFWAEPYAIMAHGSAMLSAYLASVMVAGNMDAYEYEVGARNYMKEATGYLADQLFDPSERKWASYNTMDGWQRCKGDKRLAVTADTPPGVAAYAGKDSVTGKVGVVLVNFGWANRLERTVKLNLSGLAGKYKLTHYRVDEAHSRWEQGKETPAGDAFDDLAQIDTQTLTNPTSVTVQAPRWSSTFLTLEPA